MRAWTIAALALAGGAAWGHEWMVWGYGGQSWFLLGSEDFRRGYGIAVQRVTPGIKMFRRADRTSLVWEANFTRTDGGNKFEYGPDHTLAVGALALLRFESKPSGARAYFEAGWGFQWASEETIDLPSRWNSTPTLGVGFVLPSHDDELYVGLRFMHISNAGTKGNNPGQNQVFLMLGWKF